MGTPLLPILLGIVGAMLLAKALVLHLRLKQLRLKSEVARRSWLAVPAKVLYSRVEESRPMDGVRPGMKMFSARFRYEYSLDGKRYEGTQYSLFKEWSSNDREPHDKEAAQFPEGRDVTVRVNPLDPTESVLQANPASFPVMTVPIFLLALVGLGLVGAALVMARGLWPS